MSESKDRKTISVLVIPSTGFNRGGRRDLRDSKFDNVYVGILKNGFLFMEYEKFSELVSQAIGALPAEFLDRLENVDVVVEDKPTSGQLGKAKSGKEAVLLLGLYEGVPLTLRNAGYNMVLPDKITLFQQSIEQICRNDAEVSLQIQKTLKHEIAITLALATKDLRNSRKKRISLFFGVVGLDQLQLVGVLLSELARFYLTAFDNDIEDFAALHTAVRTGI